MSAASPKYSHRSLWDLPNCTSSQESQAGPLPCVLPDGPTTSRALQDRVLASRSAPQEKAKATPTSDISGLSSSESSTPCGSTTCSVNKSLPPSLSEKLADKLKIRLSRFGSMEYRLTWNQRATPAGRLFFQLAASALHTSAPASGGVQSSTKSLFDDEPEESCDPLTGWPTPTSLSFAESHQPGNNRSMNKTVELAGWVSPTAQDHSRGGMPPRPHDTGIPLSQQVAGIEMPQSSMELSGWGTPRVTTNNGIGGESRACDGRSRLEDQVMGTPVESMAFPAGWVTPSTRDWKDTAGMSETGVNPDGSIRERMDQLPRQVHGLITESSPAGTARTGVLSAAFPRWLQGYPESWDECAPYSKEWATVQKKLTECAGDHEAFSRWLAETALAG